MTKRRRRCLETDEAARPQIAPFIFTKRLSHPENAFSRDAAKLKAPASQQAKLVSLFSAIWLLSVFSQEIA
jgi:hypothetical protein